MISLSFVHIGSFFHLFLLSFMDSTDGTSMASHLNVRVIMIQNKRESEDLYQHIQMDGMLAFVLNVSKNVKRRQSMLLDKILSFSDRLKEFLMRSKRIVSILEPIQELAVKLSIKNAFSARFMDGFMMGSQVFVLTMMVSQCKCKTQSITKIFVKRVTNYHG